LLFKIKALAVFLQNNKEKALKKIIKNYLELKYKTYQEKNVH